MLDKVQLDTPGIHVVADNKVHGTLIRTTNDGNCWISLEDRPGWSAWYEANRLTEIEDKKDG
jgi:hypothetical protein